MTHDEERDIRESEAHDWHDERQPGCKFCCPWLRKLTDDNHDRNN